MDSLAEISTNAKREANANVEMSARTFPNNVFSTN